MPPDLNVGQRIGMSLKPDPDVLFVSYNALLFKISYANVNVHQSKSLLIPAFFLKD
jgi:hypothetical protein